MCSLRLDSVSNASEMLSLSQYKGKEISEQEVANINH